MFFYTTTELNVGLFGIRNKYWEECNLNNPCDVGQNVNCAWHIYQKFGNFKAWPLSSANCGC
jgi:hypothetical protein